MQVATDQGVTAIVALHGGGYSTMAQRFVAVMRKQSLPSRIVIVEQAVPGSQLYRHLACELGVDYACAYPERGPRGEVYFCKGRSLNVGVAMAKTDHILFTDVDIVPVTGEWLARGVEALRQPALDVLTAPWMLRMVDREDAAIEEWFLSDGKAQQVDDELVAGCYCTVQNGVLRPLAEGVLQLQQNGESYVCLQAVFETYRCGRGKFLKPPWKSTRHQGTILCRRSVAIRAAGFCEDYLVWGFEDLDFVEKCRTCTSVGTWNDGVIHAEHVQGYVTQGALERNRFLFKLRQRGSWKRAIAQDEEKDSFWGAFYRGDVLQRGVFLVDT